MRKGLMEHSKGQIEIMGVAFIVLLVSVGFLFFLKLNMQPKTATDPYVTYSNDQLATSFLAAALKTNVCDKYTLEDLVVNCGKGLAQNCGDTEDANDACLDALTAVREMAEDSLKVWGKKYRITFKYGNDQKVEQHECAPYIAATATTPGTPGDPTYTPASFFMPIYGTGQDVILEVMICK